MSNNRNPLTALMLSITVAALSVSAATGTLFVNTSREASLLFIPSTTIRTFSITTPDSFALDCTGPHILFQSQGWSLGKFQRIFTLDATTSDTIRARITTSSPRLIPGTTSIHSPAILLPSHAPAARTAALFARTEKPPFTSGLRIETTRQGIHRITGSELREAGVPIDRIEPRYLRLYNKGGERPLLITNDWHARIQNDDALLFFAEELLADSLTRYPSFSSVNCYWLVWDGTVSGARIVETPATPIVSKSNDPLFTPVAESYFDTVHVEKDNDIRWLGDIATPADPTDVPGITGTYDDWYWGVAGERQLTTFDFNVESPEQGQKADVTLRIKLMGLSSVASEPQDHRYDVYLNNTATGATAIWDGQQPYVYTSTPIPGRLFTAGTNTLSLLRTLPDSIPDRVALDWIEISYARGYEALNGSSVFDLQTSNLGKRVEYRISGLTSSVPEIWDIQSHRRLVGATPSGSGKQRFITFQDSSTQPARYVVQETPCYSPLAMTLDTVLDEMRIAAGTDWLAVVPRGGESALASLVSAHEMAGLTCSVIPVQQIFNRFSHGVNDPQAIRDLVATLVDRPHPLRYLLLAGDASHDLYKQRRELTLVPTHLSRTPNWGPSSDDGWFATVKGNDNFPDIAVGRLPARSIDELRSVAEKSARYITGFEYAPWHDRILALGGFEQEFTQFNDRFQNDFIAHTLSTTRFDAWPQSRWYSPGATASTVIANAINSGTYIVNFCGHGGGNTWSDNRFFGISDCSRLTNGRWPGGGRLPFVFSYTCLTGFFESAFYSSLGEELVRLPQDGAICFYGASAYTKRGIDMRLSEQVFSLLANSDSLSIGELTAHAETALLATEGSDGLTLVRQYNLLGDPAIRIALAPRTPPATPLALRGSDSILVVRPNGSFKNGQAVFETWTGFDKRESLVQGPLGDTLAIALPAPKEATDDGMARIFYWNDTADQLILLPFSHNSVAATDVRIEPPLPGIGDSVTISCLLHTSTPNDTPTLVCQHTVDLQTKTDPLFSENSLIPMIFNAATGRFESVSKVVVAAPVRGLHPDDKFTVQFRSTDGLYSAYSRFPIAGRPDLAFSGDRPALCWQNDSLCAAFSFVNKGTITIDSASVLLTNATADTIRSIRRYTDIAPGAAVLDTLSLPDNAGYSTVTIHLTDLSYRETSTNDNRDSLSYAVGIGRIAALADTVASAGGGLRAAPVAKPAKAFRVFIVNVSDVSKNSSIAGSGDTATKWEIHTRPALSTRLSYVIQPDTSVLLVLRDTNTKLVLQPDGSGGIPFEATESTMLLAAETGHRGPFRVLLSHDQTPPTVRLITAGREISFTDYTPKNKPFSIQISDSSGIDTAHLTIQQNGHDIATSRTASPVCSDSNRTVVITLYPEPEFSVDTLTVTAIDNTGNSTTKSFSYRAGEDLSIRFFSCHPSPFGAKPGRTIRFACLLTDEADDLNLSIFTIAGRRIYESVEKNGIVGYHEIAWDGLDQNDNQLANGTYYAKLVAKNAARTVTKIIRIAKLSGYQQ